MATDVEIANLALAHLGADTNLVSLNPPDGTIEGGFAARYLPIARRLLLGYFEWGFASKRTQLAPLQNNPSTFWKFAYQLPSDCLKPWRVLGPESENEKDGADFSIEAGVVLTNASPAVLMYTKDVQDYARFTPPFESALTYMLASFLAGPLIRGPEGTQVSKGLRDMAASEAAKASASDANAAGVRHKEEEDWIPEGVKARG